MPRDPLSPRAILTILYSRTINNMSYRIIYPFLPVLARGLGVTIETAGQLAAAQGGAGMLAPLFGHLSDRHGRRRIMVLGQWVLCVASLAVLLTDQFYLLLFAFAGFGIGKGIYDPAMQGYVGDLVPYAQRGRIVGITELAWSFAWLIGVPLAGVLIDRAGWQSPWALIAALSVVGAVLTQRMLPDARTAPPAAPPPRPAPWVALLRQPRVAAALFVSLGLLFALENVLIVYGAFLEDSYGLATTAIGMVSVAIGLAELLAEGGTVFITDRLGKQRSVLWGLLLFAISLLLLLPLAGRLWSALLAFSAVILFFEFALVSLIAALTELAPQARGRLMSFNIAAMGTGRLLAPLIGTTLYARTGALTANVLLSAAVSLLCVLVIGRGLRGM
ncbi:MAG: MFS transporter [Anaerolineales bacterium]|nr:MFS transporter [Anaerolineales bacterium]